MIHLHNFDDISKLMVQPTKSGGLRLLAGRWAAYARAPLKCASDLKFDSEFDAVTAVDNLFTS